MSYATTTTAEWSPATGTARASSSLAGGCRRASRETGRVAFRLAADGVLVVHLLFIGFVAAGGFMLWRWPRLVYVHVPAALWGVVVSVFRLECPLTPLEKSLRRSAGDSGYDGGFIEHYLVGAIYPSGLTPAMRVGVGVLLAAVTALAYAGFLRRARLHERRPQLSS